MRVSTGVLCAIYIVGLAFALPATGQNGDVTLTIGSVGGGVGETVDVPVMIASTGPEVEVVNLVINFDDENLNFVDVRAGDALPEDGTVGGNVFPFGVLNLVAFALPVAKGVVDVPGIPDGVLFILEFEIVSGDDGSVFPLMGDPDESNVAVEGEEEIIPMLVDGQIDLSCEPPAAPTNVMATDGDPDGVTVTWDAVATKGQVIEYRVFRSEQNNPNLTAAVSDWQTETMFLDGAAPGPVLMAGCFGEEVIVTQEFFYFVRARNQPGCESAFSASDSGFRGGDPVKMNGVAHVTGFGISSGMGFGIVAAGYVALLAVRRKRSTL